IFKGAPEASVSLLLEEPQPTLVSATTATRPHASTLRALTTCMPTIVLLPASPSLVGSSARCRGRLHDHRPAPCLVNACQAPFGLCCQATRPILSCNHQRASNDRASIQLRRTPQGYRSPEHRSSPSARLERKDSPSEAYHWRLPATRPPARALSRARTPRRSRREFLRAEAYHR